MTDDEVRALAAKLAAGWARIMEAKFDELQAQLNALKEKINAHH